MLRSLASALVAQPRATLAELSEAIGVSWATLYRFCPTREEILHRVMRHSMEVHSAIAKQCAEGDRPAAEVFDWMVERYVEEREFAAFAFVHWSDLSDHQAFTGFSWDETLQMMKVAAAIAFDV